MHIHNLDPFNLGTCVTCELKPLHFTQLLTLQEMNVNGKWRSCTNRGSGSSLWNNTSDYVYLSFFNCTVSSILCNVL